MEISQGNSLYSYLKQTKISFSLFYKIREQDGRICPVWVFGTSGREEKVEKW
jgi:hypothetical protein